jgi:hypothetical protein
MDGVDGRHGSVIGIATPRLRGMNKAACTVPRVAARRREQKRRSRKNPDGTHPGTRCMSEETTDGPAAMRTHRGASPQPYITARA